MARSDEPIKTPRAQRVLLFRQRQLPAVVWVASAIVCGWLLFSRVQRFEYVGLAQVAQHEISSPLTGRLAAVFVELYEPVAVGDVVAKLDDSALEARISTTQASIRRLQTELVGERSRLQVSDAHGLASWTRNLRRFQADEAERRLLALERRATIEADEIQLERLSLEVQRVGRLLDSGLVSQQQHDDARLRRDEVRKRVEESRGLLAQTEDEYRAAQARREQFERGLPQLAATEVQLAPLREAVTVESQRLREIEIEREALVLRSPVQGQVTQILCRSGQAVVRGEPILTVAEPVVRDIVAFLHETDRRSIRANTPVLVSSLDQPERSTESYVTRVGSALEVLPQRLWRNPSVPDWGRPVLIAPVPEMTLTPGERLSVTFLSN